MNIGEKICYHRKRAGISQKDLGHQLDVSRKTVELWESGKADPSLNEIKRIKEIFGVSFDDILGEQQPKEKESAPIESYRFTYARVDLKSIGIRMAMPLVIIAAAVIALMALLAVLAVAESYPPIIIIFAVAAALATAVAASKRFVLTVRAWASADHILESTYYYEAYSDCFLLHIVRGGETVKSTKVYYSEISKVVTTPGFLLVFAAGQCYLIVREELAERSSFAAYIGKRRAELAPKLPQGKLRIISTCLKVASIAAVIPAMIVAAVIPTESLTVASNMWVFLPFAAIPIAAIAFAYYLQSKNCRATSLKVIGAIMAVILIAFGCISFFVKDPYIHGGEAVTEAESLLGIDIPEYLAVDNLDWGEAEQLTRGRIIKTSDIYFTSSAVADFEAAIDGEGSKWLNAIPSAMVGITPEYSESVEYDYAIIYNVDTKQINELPAESGSYEFLAAFYSTEEDMMSLVRYTLSYSK